jgi:hypothetical protein
MARPRKQIDYKLVEKLGKIHCTQEEIAQVSGLSVDTLQLLPWPLTEHANPYYRVAGVTSSRTLASL